MKIIILVFNVCFLIVFACQAQQPHFIHYNDENGIEDNEVYDIFQSKNKMIWISGNSGIFNFNGKIFKSFTSSQQQSNSLTGMQEDKYNRIWVHDFSNRIFYIENDSLIRFTHWNTVFKGSFPRILIDSLDRLWIFVNSKVSCFQLSKNINQSKLILEFEIENSRTAFYHKQILYFTTLDKIISIDKNMIRKQILVKGIEGRSFLTGQTSFFLVNGTLHILLGINRSVYKQKNDAFVFVKKFNVNSFINSCKIIDNKFWIFSRNGAHKYSNDFTFEKTFFPHLSVSNLIKDNEDGYWFCSLNEGIYYVPNIDITTFNSQTNKTLPNGFSVVKTLYNTVFTGAVNGKLYRYNSGKLDLVFKDTKEKEFSFLSGNNLYLHFGAFNKYCYSISTNKTTRISINPTIKQADSIAPEIMLQAQPNGLFAIHRKSSNIKNKILEFNIFSKTNQYAKNKYEEQITTNKTNNFYFNNQKKYLVCGTKDELIRIENKQQTIIRYNGQSIYATSMAAKGDSIWISTNNFGILLYTNGKIFEQQNINKNLYSFKINKLYLNKESLFIAHKQGIQVYNIKTNALGYINKKNGLFSYKISDISVCNDTIYIASPKGFIVIPKEKQICKPIKPIVYINKIFNDKTTFDKNNTFMKLVNTNNLSIDLNLVSFKNRDNINLFYRFEGLENQWKKTSDEKNRIDFDALDYKKYELAVYAIDKNNGVQSDKIRLFIDVVAPFYLQIWFFVFVAVLLLILVYFTLRYRLENIKKKNTVLLEKERLEKALKSSTLASIKSQMNPHFMFNSLNTIQSYVLSNERLKANFYLGKFSDLMRRILAMSAKDVINLDEEIETLHTYLELENMRFNNELTYKIILPKDFENISIHVPTMIIQPFVENAIKHGLLHKKTNKKLTIIFDIVQNNLLKVRILDNGIGRYAAVQIKNRNPQANASFSINANRKRLDLLNETISNKISLQINDLGSQVASEGTEVVLFIPFD